MTTQGQGGYPGQQGLSDNATDYNKHARQIWQMLAYVRTVVPVKVIAVHPNGDDSGGFVDVQLLVNQMDGGGNTFPHGTVFNLPYFQYQSGTSAMVMDPTVGDMGLAAICDRDISSVKANKGQANPGSRRRFGLPDGIYFGGILNGVPTQKIKFTPTGIQITPAPGNPVTINGDIHATGAVIAGFGGADQVSLQTHKHGTGAAAAGTSPPTAGT